jgi:crotonobetainyl-CoA:carnitine CoA-transferase CaiB-like acyl-CoA transferase
MAARDSETALATLEAAEIPAAAGKTIADIFENPQYAAREAIVSVEDPALGTVRMQGVTPKLSKTPGSVRRGAPLLGEHNAEVYGGLLGLSESEQARLREQGTI